ncbi:MAG TPA: hypothetical protein VGZ25_16740 [Gemmataceae bacterium]|nr:hypothetical protein [Gemmataceae bacterium]
MLAFTVSLAVSMALDARLEAQLAAFPPREVVAVETQFAREHGRFLRKMRDAVPFDAEHFLWYRYFTKSYWLWVQLRMAQDKTETLEKRTACLEKLKAQLDRDINLRGRMPPAVCYWRFREGPPPPDFPEFEPPKRRPAPIHPRAN